MVGIARARGCGTCRQRKIACGLEKPSCAQCIKSHRTCTGYRRYPIFIPHQPRDEKKSKDDALAPRSSLAKLDARRTRRNAAAVPPPPPAPASSVARAALGRPGLFEEISSNACMRQQMLGEFLRHHLPTGNLGPMQRRLWLLNLPNLTDPTAALEVSLMALCMAKLGNLHHDAGLRLDSLKLYHRGLGHLQQALWHPELMYHDQTLGACVVLAMYELSECPSDSKFGYISHTRGCERLVQLRGPAAHTEGLGHQIFVHFRIQGILYALDTRKHTFLSDPAWQEIPFRRYPKTTYDRMYDFITLAPELLIQGQMLQYMDRDAQLELASTMITRCWAMDAAIADLYRDLEHDHPAPIFWPELAQEDMADTETAEEGMVFPVAFHFANLTVANTVLVYWTVQSMVWHGLGQLYGLLHEILAHFSVDDGAETAETAEALPVAAAAQSKADFIRRLLAQKPLTHRTDFARPCRNIFQSVEYCLLPEMLDHGPKSLAAPLRIAMETLRPYADYQEDVAWAEGAMKRVQQRSLRLLIYYTGVEGRDGP